MPRLHGVQPCINCSDECAENALYDRPVRAGFVGIDLTAERGPAATGRRGKPTPSRNRPSPFGGSSSDRTHGGSPWAEPLAIELEYAFWDTTLPASHTPQGVIKLYQDHGNHEQFHSEYTTDLDLERLPSGKFATNDLIPSLAMLAYNVLRLMGQSALYCRPTPQCAIRPSGAASRRSFRNLSP